MFYDFGGSGTKSSTCAKGASQRADDHVNEVWVHVLEFRQATGSAAKDTERRALIEYEAKPVAGFEGNLQRKDV